MSTESSLGAAARTMKASEFKAKCLKLMDEVAQGGGEIIITKNGKPVAKLAPCRKAPKAPFGRDRDNIRVLDDIISPIGVEWETESNPDRILNP